MGLERNLETIKNIWMLTKKNITLYVRKGPVLIFGLMFPFFMVLSWVLGRQITLSQIFVGIVAMTSFFTATAISPVILPIETREKSLERLLSAPISVIEILSSIIIASTIYSIIITSIIAVIFLIPIFALVASPLAIFLIFIGISLMAVLGSIIGLLVSAKPTDQTSDIMILMNLVKFPLLFIGGVFIPLVAVPSTVAVIYFLSPVTLLTEILRNCVNEPTFISMEMSLLGLLIWTIFAFVITYAMHKKTMVKRFSETGGSNKKMMMMKQKQI
ncbi:MAG: ABC transporter permease [Candidatus Helarchaeota archaeon]